MASVKNTLALGLSFLLSGCGNTITLTSYVETDTYISSSDPANHAELPYFKVSSANGVEERALLKLPTGKESTDYNLSQLLANPAAWPLAPFFIVLDIFAQFFNCTSTPLAASNLQSAYLVLNVSQNAGGGSLASKMNIQLSAKPWWQTVNWKQAHSFSTSGQWAQQGGDPDSSFTPIASADGTATGTIQFDVTSYFKTLLQNQEQPHYGFIMRSVSGTLAPVTLASVQSTDSSQKPRLVSTYKCISPSGSLQAQDQPQSYTYVLGPK
jgi:hypothetical protein